MKFGTEPRLDRNKSVLEKWKNQRNPHHANPNMHYPRLYWLLQSLKYVLRAFSVLHYISFTNKYDTTNSR